MNVIEAARVSPHQLRALDGFVEGLAPSELRDLLRGLTANIRTGADVTLAESDAEMTPAQAASRLRMSRTHLYKLLDRGEIVSHRVGRDRRIRFADLARFEATRQHDRRELAERFAHATQTRDAAIDELAADL